MAEKAKSDLKAIKINNGAWLPVIAEHIEAFCKKAHVDGIQPGNLQTYFAQIAQGCWYGNSEFWMVFDEEEPVAFAAWYTLGLPHIAKVYCLAMYSWVKDPEVAGLLMDEFIKFGVRHRAVWFSADLISKPLVRLIKKKAKERGFNLKDSNLTHVIMKRG